MILKTYLFIVFLAVLIILPEVFIPVNAYAQENEQSEELLVRSVRFDGNRNIRNGTLRTVVRTQKNREIFGIPGATLWLALNRISSALGEPPRFLDRDIVGRDIERLQTFYEYNGFFDARIDTTIEKIRSGRVRVIFSIDEGEPSFVRTVAFSGVPDLEDERQNERFYSRSVIARSAIDDTTFNVNRQYSVDLISEERNRIINILRRNGYASVQRDSIRVLVRPDPDEPKELDILFRIRPGDIYYFGDVRMDLRAPESIAENIEIAFSDTVSGEPLTIEPNKIFVNREEQTRTRPSTLYNRILFKPGERFNNDLYLSSVNQFQTLDMLVLRQFSLTEDGGLPDYSQKYLPVYFDLQTLPRHQIRSELFGLQRLGLGAGAGVSYRNNNLLQRGEQLEIGVNGSFEYVTGSSSAQRQVLRNIEGRVNYALPFLAFPFASLNNNPNFLNPRTSFQFSAARVNQINFNIDANFRFNIQFEASHNQSTRSFLDILELEWIDASATPEFINNITENISDTLQIQRILEDFRPQFNSTLRYTFRNSTTHIVRRDRGFYLESSIEVSGNLPYAIERFALDRDTLQSTIPSFSISGRDLAYSQFVKGSVDFRRYYSLNQNTVFAFRGFAGYAYPFGQSRVIPLNRRFFAGGANDIRGWDPFRLGPGGIDEREVPINGGDIKLAGFAELRYVFSRNFLSTNWIIAAFTDIGNIWYGPRSEFTEGQFKLDTFLDELAVGSGIGLRLDWDFVVFRIDLAYRMRDLGNEPGTNFLQRSNFHFGIGHSF